MTQKKISRRDAIKLLGAVTGATVLANLPSKWSTPQIARGVLPAHAQTSQTITYSLTCGNSPAPFDSSPINVNVGISINPGDSGINMDYVLTCSCNPLTQNINIVGIGNFGTIPTGVGGLISIPIQITVTPTNLIAGASGQIDIYWSFDDPSQANIPFDCTQSISWNIPGVIP